MNQRYRTLLWMLAAAVGLALVVALLTRFLGLPAMVALIQSGQFRLEGISQAQWLANPVRDMAKFTASFPYSAASASICRACSLRWLGHSGISVTLDIYSHVGIGLKRAAVDELSGLLSESGPQ